MSVASWIRACAGTGVVVLSLAACGSSPSATGGLVNVSDAGAPASADSGFADATLTLVSGSLTLDDGKDFSTTFVIDKVNDFIAGTTSKKEPFKAADWVDGQDWRDAAIFMSETSGGEYVGALYENTTLENVAFTHDDTSGKVTMTSGILRNQNSGWWTDVLRLDTSGTLDLAGIPATVNPDGSITVNGLLPQAGGEKVTVKLQFELRAA